MKIISKCWYNSAVTDSFNSCFIVLSDESIVIVDDGGGGGVTCNDILLRGDDVVPPFEIRLSALVEYLYLLVMVELNEIEHDMFPNHNLLMTLHHQDV